MAVIVVYKRNSTFIDLSDLVAEVSTSGLTEALEKHYEKPEEREAKRIVAGPSSLQFLNRLFKIQVRSGDIFQLESANHHKYYMLSGTGT
jgi:hypothetical protein